MRTIVLIFLFLTLTVTPVYADDLRDGAAAALAGDYELALDKLKPFAEQGNVHAQDTLRIMYYHLGQMYLNGGGKEVPLDDKEARKWFRLAAEEGEAGAQYDLGLMYGRGRGGLKDYVEAHKWFNLAGANGYEDGNKYRDIIEKGMTLAQKAEAMQLAREWMEKRQKGSQ